MGKKNIPPKKTPPSGPMRKAPPPQKPTSQPPLSKAKYTPPPQKSAPQQPPSMAKRVPPSAARTPSTAGVSASSEQIEALGESLQSLQERVALSDYKQYLADFDTGISTLSNQIAEIRSRGYRYKGFLEGKFQTLETKWQTARGDMSREIEQSESVLQGLCNGAASEVNRAYSAPGVIPSAQSALSNLETRISAAESAIQATYSGIQAALSQTQQQIQEAAWMLDQIDQAEFNLLAEENPVQAVRAKWWRDGEDKGPNGILYLTDQRLIFEQKEEIATKKVLFITTEKETVQSLLFEAPIGSIESVKSSHRGLMGNQDHLDFTFGQAAPYANAHFHLDGQDSDYWDGLVKRVQNGDIRREWHYAEGETPEAATQAAEDTLTNAPEKCTSCGAPFDAPIARGQRQIQCDYCGTTMRW